MSAWFFIQFTINVSLILACVVLWIRLGKPQKDDPRLSKGLQLLQSKIAILEDLSDRTENQVNQMIALMERKSIDIQKWIQEAERHVQKIQKSMEKSLEVARIFEDKIPHEEIIDRKQRMKYFEVARMANPGVSIDDIAQQVELPRGEIELIIKTNKNKILVNDPLTTPEIPQDQIATLDLSSAFDVPKVSTDSLREIGEKFRQAVTPGKTQNPPIAQVQFKKVNLSDNLG